MGEIENWKDVVGYEGAYQISTKGRFKSLDRCLPNGKFLNGKLMKPFKRGDYLAIHLCMDGNRKIMNIHQLMAIAFLGHKIDGHKAVVHHLDNNPYNNSIENLEITSQRKNCKTHVKGTSKHMGVWRISRNGLYGASIEVDGKKHWLGQYENEDDAGLAYQKALVKFNLI